MIDSERVSEYVADAIDDVRPRWIRSEHVSSGGYCSEVRRVLYEVALAADVEERVARRIHNLDAAESARLLDDLFVRCCQSVERGR